jgi:hypothetical protein
VLAGESLQPLNKSLQDLAGLGPFVQTAQGLPEPERRLDVVRVLLQSSASHGGEFLEVSYGHIQRGELLGGGLITRIDEYTERADALEAAGLSDAAD